MVENNAEYKLVNIKMGLFKIESLFGLKADEDEYLENALNCLRLIGNLYSIIVRYDATTDSEGYVCLPSEAFEVEAVSSGVYDWIAYSYRNVPSSLYPNGTFLPYVFDGEGVKTEMKDKKISIIYRTFVADETGLPLVTEAEAEACAYWWLFVHTRKKVLRGEQLASSLLPMIEKDKNKALNQARCQMNLSQNYLDQLANSLFSQDRKVYGQSFKPVKLR